MYTPKPIDTSSVQLSKDLLKLTELISENIHEVWSHHRISEGWTLGPVRNDKLKTHPCLIPYDQLPDIEKQYDRNTALETLKTIMALGYKILDPEHIEQAIPNEDEEITAILVQLRQPPPLKLSTLTRIWESRLKTLWAKNSEVYLLLGNHFSKVGAILQAYDVLSEGLESWPKDFKMRLLQAQALIKSGSVQKANLIFRQLYFEGHTDKDTMGGLARTHKDLWTHATNAEDKQQQLQSAYRFYKQSYELNKDSYTGINAASMAMILGEKEIATQIAGEVFAICIHEIDMLKDTGGDLYWSYATLGEINLVLGNLSEAEKWYSRAAVQGRGRYSDLSSTRRQARLLADYLFNERARFDDCFRIPPVTVFAGHTIDRPGRPISRFPVEMESCIREEIKKKLLALETRFGFAAAACGSDILFHECMLDLNAEIVVVLPYERNQFKKDRVELIPGSNWGERFDRILDAASEVITVSEQRMEGGSASYTYANLLLHGMASLKAEKLETTLVPLTVWDEQVSNATGDVYDLVRHWQQQNYAFQVINPVRVALAQQPLLRRAATMPTPDTESDIPRERSELSTQIKAMMFADAVNFSKLKESEIPLFLHHFMGAIAELIKLTPHKPVMKNTWGDGLYFVFSDVRAAGLFSLELCELVGSTRWAEKGLPSSLNLRVALHAGPVYESIDPVMGTINYSGTHVSKAARIEPITPPGQVYASQSFVALAMAIDTDDFVCDYVGQIHLAKGYGVFPMYHVRRSAIYLPPQTKADPNEIQHPD